MQPHLQGYSGDLDSNSTLQNKNDLHQCSFDRGQWRNIITATATADDGSSNGGTGAPSRPRPRSAHSSFAHGSHLYVFGGFDGQERLSDMWRIKLASSTSAGPGGKAAAGRGPTATLPPAPRWEMVTQGGTLPPSCCHSPPVVADGIMYVFSGHSGKETSNRVFAMDLQTHCWAVLAPCHPLNGGALAPARRFGHSMIHHGSERESALWVS